MDPYTAFTQLMRTFPKGYSSPVVEIVFDDIGAAISPKIYFPLNYHFFSQFMAGFSMMNFPRGRNENLEYDYSNVNDDPEFRAFSLGMSLRDFLRCAYKRDVPIQNVPPIQLSTLVDFGPTNDLASQVWWIPATTLPRTVYDKCDFVIVATNVNVWKSPLDVVLFSFEVFNTFFSPVRSLFNSTFMPMEISTLRGPLYIPPCTEVAKVPSVPGGLDSFVRAHFENYTCEYSDGVEPRRYVREMDDQLMFDACSAYVDLDRVARKVNQEGRSIASTRLKKFGSDHGCRFSAYPMSFPLHSVLIKWVSERDCQKSINNLYEWWVLQCTARVDGVGDVRGKTKSCVTVHFAERPRFIPFDRIARLFGAFGDLTWQAPFGQCDVIVSAAK